MATVLVIITGYLAIADAVGPSRPLSGLALPTTTTSRPSPTPWKPASAVTVVRPDRIGTRDRITEGEYAAKAASTEAKLKAALGTDESFVVAYYGTTDRAIDQIYVVGSTIAGRLGRSTFDSEFRKIGPSIGGRPVTGITSVPTGSAPGFVKCGETIQSAMTVSVCAFSNGYDFVVVHWYNRQLSDDIKEEVLAIRALVEQ